MANPLRILFMGTPDFAVPSLQTLIDGPDKVIGVVCQPDRKKGRGRKLAPPPVKELALEHELQVLQPDKVKTDAFFAELEALKPDLIVVVAYGKILSERILTLPRLGAINVHGSLLPLYRGAAPIQWALLNGDKETGVTIMQMDVGMDTGDMLLQTTMPITEQDTAGSLFDQLSALGAQTLGKAVAALQRGELKPTPQNDALATHAPMLSKEQGHLDWSKPANVIHCHIRGLDPWPSAYGYLHGKRFRFFSPELVAKNAQEVPGTVCQADASGLLIATGTDYIRIKEIQPEGKKRMDVQACLCGTTITPGDLFT